MLSGTTRIQVTVSRLDGNVDDGKLMLHVGIKVWGGCVILLQTPSTRSPVYVVCWVELSVYNAPHLEENTNVTRSREIQGLRISCRDSWLVIFGTLSHENTLIKEASRQITERLRSELIEKDFPRF